MGKNWTDLRTRVLSAIVMLAIAGSALWLGQTAMLAVVCVICGIAFWEIGTIGGLAYRRSVFLGILALLSAIVVFFAFWSESIWTHVAVLLIPVVATAVLIVSTKKPVTAYAVLTTAGVYSVGYLIASGLYTHLLVLVGLVILSDVAGYFAGRMLCGPKFWPAVSPKKTWSGTVAGWIAGALLAAAFILNGNTVGVLFLAVLVVFAAQLGDIAQSAVKRKAGIKDSSNIIPGHGGVLDRFDALISAAIVMVLLLPLGWLEIGLG